tara:strand:+ start:821 stop:1162 length:342 start_codon:yes stop_codon:yes gene_type:complete
MPDLFDDFSKRLKNEFVPILVKYFKDPNNKINDNINDFLNDSRNFLTEVLEKISKNSNDDIYQRNNTDFENINSINQPVQTDEYADLLKRLISIEENMIQIQKKIKDEKIEEY